MASNALDRLLLCLFHVIIPENSVHSRRDEVAHDPLDAGSEEVDRLDSKTDTHRLKGLKVLAHMIARAHSDRSKECPREPEQVPAIRKGATSGGVYPASEAEQSTAESETSTGRGRGTPVGESEGGS